MPIKPSYPGVYVEEIPSGAHTITGVSTSITAFIGTTKRGPINRAERVLGFADFERRYGGLSSDSILSYAVRQFFVNGGGEAIIVRLAGNPIAATTTLVDATTPAARNVIDVAARDQGKAGNAVEVRVTYPSAGNTESNFNLAFAYVSPDNPADSIAESFENLSMNSDDPRYFKTAINGRSELVTVERNAAMTSAILGALPAATSTSGDIFAGGAATVADLVDGTHRRFRVSVNGSDPVNVVLDLATDVASIAALCTGIQREVVNAAAGNIALSGFLCAPEGTNRIKMTSGAGGEKSTIRVFPGDQHDVSARLRLGSANGGTEKDAVAAIRPAQAPEAGKLTSGATPALPGAAATKFNLALDDGPPTEIAIVIPAALADVPGAIQTAVRNAGVSEAYRNFTAKFETIGANQHLVFRSGTRGAGSSVQVTQVAGADMATPLKLLPATGATPSRGVNRTLLGGNESALTPAQQYAAFTGNPATRTGFYALDDVNLFNLLCLPGISDPGILAEAAAYCRMRRAFLIIDPEETADKPSEMEAAARSTALPQSDHAAVYYPWFYIADPLRGGALKKVPPSGTIAGVYARTDATRGVWKAPAGTDATLIGAQKVDYLLTDAENGVLNPRGVNCIRIIPPFGTISWGARTRKGDDDAASEWKYVPIRRLALYIEESLYRGTHWVVFEPNDEPLWALIRMNVGAFMQTLFAQGAFQGRSPREAYLVKCDRETTTQNDIDRGVVNILVGFAPLKPAEFVFLKIQQLARQAEA